MCGRYSLTDPGDLLVELGVEATSGALEPRYNVAPTQQAPVVRATRDGSGRELVAMRWGLVPPWADDPAVGSRMINARAESVADRPAFRQALRWRRCVVPADGFYEWKALAGPGKRAGKQPFHITRPGRAPFVFAGLWERWGERAAPLETFTILTCAPTPEIAELHDRMPVILAGDARELWLDREVEDPHLLETVLRPFPGRLVLTPVSRAVNTPDNDDPGCIAPVTLEEPPPEPRQASLF